MGVGSRSRVYTSCIGFRSGVLSGFCAVLCEFPF